MPRYEASLWLPIRWNVAFTVLTATCLIASSKPTTSIV